MNQHRRAADLFHYPQLPPHGSKQKLPANTLRCKGDKLET